jgi:hypothetical protein
MPEACYLCRRTQADLDRLNEEIRSRVYLSYFSNARSQLEELQRKIAFLQRLQDEAGTDPHLRLGATLVLGDQASYQKLLPWLGTLAEIVRSHAPPVALEGSVGELAERLLQEVRTLATGVERSLEEVRTAFSPGSGSPLGLKTVGRAFPVRWARELREFVWRPTLAGDQDPLQRRPDTVTVEVPVLVCTVCAKLLGIP